MAEAKGIPTAVAARLIGKSEDFIRWGLRQKRLPIGSAVQMTDNRWGYYISPVLLSTFTGVKVELINEMGKEHRARLKEARQ